MTQPAGSMLLEQRLAVASWSDADSSLEALWEYRRQNESRYLANEFDENSRKAPQLTLSIRISEALRDFLERSKHVISSNRGESVSLSEVARILRFARG